MSVPAWKLALLERKKKQEDEQKAKQAQAEEAKIASLPAWKRAILLREKQAKGVVTSSTPATTSEPTTPKWQVAVERVKGSDSPILTQRPSWKSAANAAPPSPKPAAAAARGAPPPFSTPAKATTSPSPKLPIANNLVASKWKQPQTSETSSAKKQTAPAPAKSTASNQLEEDPSLAGLPAWKKALILKKRKARSPAVEEESTTPKGEDEPDSADQSEATPSTQNGLPVANQPEVVNRSNGGEGEAPSRLVELEGKTLHPPVYKEVDEWANVKEQDDKFKELPLWKQALIKRRRADIAKRSGLEVPTTEPPPPAPAPAQPLAKKATRVQHTKKPDNTKPNATTTESKKSSKASSKVNSHERKRKGRLDRPSNHVQSKVHTETKKPVRKAPVAPAPKKVEPMFTYNFSKSSSSHRTLDTGGSSSDSTDSDLEDAVITNLDDESDEDDSGIVLQSYSVDKAPSQPSPSIVQKSASVYKAQPSPTMGQKSASVTTVKLSKKSSISSGKKKHMRRVSWSDTQLTSEHFYPKYDYSDYDDMEREEENKNKFMAALAKENSGLSHRLHPSLRRNNDTDTYSGYGGFSPTSAAPRSTTSENSLGSFVPKTLSGNGPLMFSGYTDNSPQTADDKEEVNESPQELEVVQEQTDDFYADLTSNTAALLW